MGKRAASNEIYANFELNSKGFNLYFFHATLLFHNIITKVSEIFTKNERDLILNILAANALRLFWG